MKPILMTVLSTCFGVLPTALAIAEGSEFRQPMAIVLIFGLLFGTTLSLLVIPSAYCIWDQVGNFFTSLGRRIFSRPNATGAPEPDGGVDS